MFRQPMDTASRNYMNRTEYMLLFGDYGSGKSHVHTVLRVLRLGKPHVFHHSIVSAPRVILIDVIHAVL